MLDNTDTGVLQKHVTLGDLLDLPSFTEVCQNFADLYRIGLKVIDSSGELLVDIKTGSPPFCAYMFSTTAGKVLCTETVTHVRQRALEPAPGSVAVRDCFSGCRYVMSPVLHEGSEIGRVVFGPFVPEDLKDLGRELLALEVYDRARARELLSHVRRAPEPTVRKVLAHFGRILDVLVFTSYRSLLTSQLHIESVTESYRELQQKNAKLRESLDRLAEVDRLKGEFLATMSHELRTPLTSVIGYSEMLLAGLAGSLGDEQREYVQTILEKGESLLGLITSLLDVSRIEARGVRLDRQSVDVSQVVQSALTTLVPAAQKKQVLMSTEATDDLPAAWVDGDKLRQCVVNLLSNAVKFTPPGGRVAIRWGLARQGADGAGPFGRAGRFEISVSDSGPGIDPAQQDKIFDMFYQVDGSSTREHGGAGLGLSIVRSYAEAHGGEVRVDSRPGEGATFTLTLPLESAPAAAGLRRADGA